MFPGLVWGIVLVQTIEYVCIYLEGKMNKIFVILATIFAMLTTSALADGGYRKTGVLSQN